MTQEGQSEDWGEQKDQSRHAYIMKGRSVQGICGARRTGRPWAPPAATPLAPGMCGHHHPKLCHLPFHLLVVSSGMFPNSRHLSLPPSVWALPSLDSRHLCPSHALLERGSCAPQPAGAATPLHGLLESTSQLSVYRQDGRRVGYRHEAEE